MIESPDVFDSFDEALAGGDVTNPWGSESAGRAPVYTPDHSLLENLIAIPVGESQASGTGRLAKAIDAWVAHELRRSGFPADEVWPRIQKPRVLPREVGLFVSGLPKRLRDESTERLLRNKAVAPPDARVLGRAYVKQIDVLVT